MSLLNWLRRRTPALDHPGTDFPGVSAPAAILAQVEHEITLQPSIDPLIPAKIADPSDPIELDHLNVAIDYVDAAGNRTRRPITIRSISSTEGHLILSALCHLRGAVRTFRVDRIDDFVTEDGEVISPAIYLHDAFHIDIKTFSQILPESAKDPLIEARKARDILRPMLSILVLLARADGDFHREELDAILRYAERELIEMERLGHLAMGVSIPMLDQLTNVIRQMRPGAESLDDYVARVETLNQASQDRFWRTLQEVTIADGDASNEEAEFEAIVEAMRYR